MNTYINQGKHENIFSLGPASVEAPVKTLVNDRGCLGLLEALHLCCPCKLYTWSVSFTIYVQFIVNQVCVLPLFLCFFHHFAIDLQRSLSENLVKCHDLLIPAPSLYTTWAPPFIL